MKACCVHYGRGVLNLWVKHIIPISRFGTGSNYQYWFISSGFYWYMTSLQRCISENTCFPRQVMIATLYFFSTFFYQYYSRHGAQVKKHSKRKLQILNADFSPQSLMRLAGLLWFEIMNPL